MGSALSPLLFPHPKRDDHLGAGALKRAQGLVWINTENYGQVPALFYHKRDAKFTLLYTHGNAEDLSEVMGELSQMAAACNASVFAVEYPGYSISTQDAPSEGGCYEAVIAAYDYLTEKRGIAPGHIVPFGRSLGSGPAVHLASERHGVGGLVLQSPLESGARALNLPHWVGYLGYGVDPFKNYEKIRNVRAMTCIIHGTNDLVVHVSNGQNLWEELRRKGLAAQPLWLENFGHNNMPMERVWRHVKDFLNGIQ